MNCYLVRGENDSPMVTMRLGEAEWYRGLYVFGGGRAFKGSLLYFAGNWRIA